MTRNNTRQFLSDSLLEIINYSKVASIFKNIPMENCNYDWIASIHFLEYHRGLLATFLEPAVYSSVSQ
jgi:hypothetical protein